MKILNWGKLKWIFFRFVNIRSEQKKWFSCKLMKIKFQLN